MARYWTRKFLDSLLSTLPIFIVILVLYLLEKFGVWVFSSIPENEIITDPEFLAFSICAILIAFGLGLFTIGAEQSMTQIGELVGSSLMRKRKLFLIIAMTFVLGVFVTIAEPDLTVLSSQLGGISSLTVIWTIGIGVGLFLVIGVLRVVFKKPLNILFIVFYGLIFTLAYLINPRLLPICFDSGGVSTGPVTVPFILAFGVGIAASRQGSSAGDDSFGLTALCSIGPILAVMVLSRFVDPSILDAAYPTGVIPGNFWVSLGYTVLHCLREVGFAILPIAAFFLVYDLIFLRLPFVKLARIFIGLIYAFIGLVALLAAVNAGFQPLAAKVGQSLGGSGERFPAALILAAFFGLFGVLAEPAVHVLARQIETVSEGTIKQGPALGVFAISIGSAVVLAVIRSYFGFDLMYYLIPGYILALALSFMVPKIYTAIAFDSGGVASGPMTSTFVLPFCIGFSYSTLGASGEEVTTGSIYQYGFGLVALVALMPLIILQLVGLYAQIRKAVLYRQARRRIVDENDDQIIHFGKEEA